MTAKVSTNNFYTNFKYKIKSNFKIMVIILILHLVAAPLNLINFMVYLLDKQKHAAPYVDYYPNFNELYVVIGVVGTCLAAAAGIILAMNVFNYLYKKSVVDMTLSLPITTRQRFFSDFLAGAFTYLAPFIVSSVIALIINGIGSSIVTNWNMNGELDGITQTLITLIIAGFFIMLMVYVLTVLVLTCCGSFFEGFAYTVLVNGLIPGTIAVIGYIFLGNLYGIDVSTNIMPIIEKTSPIGGLIGFFNTIQENRGTLTLKASWLIPFIIITGVYFVASYLLYRKRKAESVSKPFVYKAFYYIMITSLTFCIGTLFTMDGLSNNTIPLIIITAIIYLIFEVITNRGFKKFYISAIRYAITIAAVIGISTLVDTTEGFGAVQKIPAVTNVESVEMNYGGVFSKFSNYGNSDTLYKYTDDKTIESVVKMHEMVIDRYNKDKTIDKTIGANDGSTVVNDNNMLTTIKFKYNLKSGGSFMRSYYVTVGEYIQLTNVDLTDEFKNNYIQSIMDYYNENASGYSDNVIYLNTPYDFYENKKAIDKSKVPEIINSLSMDIKAMSSEEYFTPSKETLAIISLGYDDKGSGIAINENYTNTLLCLKKYNIDLPAVDYSKICQQNVGNIFINSPEQFGIDVDGKTYYSTHGNDMKAKSRAAENSNELQQLLQYAQADYITNEACYQININGYYYIIPPKYNEISKKVFEELSTEVVEEMNGYVNDSEGNSYYYNTKEEYDAIQEKLNAANTVAEKTTQAE